MGRRASKRDMQQTEIQKIISRMAGRYTEYEIFMDWIECTALSISNTVNPFPEKLRESRETQYKTVAEKYTGKELEKFAEMLAILVGELEDNPRDVLGEVFMLSGMGSATGGQFFTPFSVSEMMAALSVDVPADGEKVTLNEPSCGAGGSIIAAALYLKSQGIDYQRRMEVVAQDLDWKCVYMCYVQLSLLGINAICVQGDTLLEPYTKGYPTHRILRTPMAMGMLL